MAFLVSVGSSISFNSFPASSLSSKRRHLSLDHLNLARPQNHHKHEPATQIAVARELQGIPMTVVSEPPELEIDTKQKKASVDGRKPGLHDGFMVPEVNAFGDTFRFCHMAY